MSVHLGRGAGKGQRRMQAQQLWQAVLGDLQVRLSKTAFDNWLRQTRIVDFADDTVTVGAANTFGAATLQARYAQQIERALSDLVGRPIRARFTVADRDDRGDGAGRGDEETGRARADKSRSD